MVIADDHDFTIDTLIFTRKVLETQISEPELERKFYGDYGEARQLFYDTRADGIAFLDEGTWPTPKVYAGPFTPSLGDWGF